MELFWLILIIIFLVIEGVTFNLITIWFAIGALAAFITTYFTDNITIQTVAFLLVTAVTLVSTRRFIKKFVGENTEKTNLDAVVGKVGIVTNEINSDSFGRVKVLGKEWTAKGDMLIKEGSKVEIIKIEGVKLVVKKKEEK